MAGMIKHYVLNTARRHWDKKIVPGYTNDHLNAFRCFSEEHARGIIQDIHDSGVKQYQTEWISVEQEAPVKLGWIFRDVPFVMS